MREISLACLLVFGACRCSPSKPAEPPVVIYAGDGAPIDGCTLACANGYAYCAGSFPDGGLTVCQTECTARLDRTPATMASVIQCEALAVSKEAFVQCGGVESCP